MMAAPKRRKNQKGAVASRLSKDERVK